MKWQPIETAPKEPEPDLDGASFGPLVLLASTSGHWAIGYWSNGEGGLPPGWVNPHNHEVMYYWNGFTHWMPLPPPPEGETP